VAGKHAKIHWADEFWNFVEANPKLATAIAFRLGNMAGEAVAGSSATARSLGKKIKAAPDQAVDAMQLLSTAALKYLPGPSPKLQPRKRPAKAKLGSTSRGSKSKAKN
jgi:hypothetical protein